MTKEANHPLTHEPIRVPDEEAQTKAFGLRHEIDVILNKSALEETNRAGEQMVVHARPVAEGYDAYMHLACGDPQDWSKLLINDTIRNEKCVGCGYPLGEPNGN